MIRLRDNSGFTLIELLFTLAILSLFASITVPLAQVQVQRAQETELRVALKEIRQGIDAYKRAWDEGKIQRVTGATGFPPSLETLVEGVPDMQDPRLRRQFFLRRLPRDPTVVDASLSNADTWGKRSYASTADYPEEGEDVYDVYSRSQKIGLNGIALNKW